jgi:hypothetical protein
LSDRGYWYLHLLLLLLPQPLSNALRLFSSNYPQDFVRNAGKKLSPCSLGGPLPGRADLASAQEQTLYLEGCSLA